MCYDKIPWHNCLLLKRSSEIDEPKKFSSCLLDPYDSDNYIDYIKIKKRINFVIKVENLSLLLRLPFRAYF